VARKLAAKASETPDLLEPAIRLLAPSVKLDADEVIRELKSVGRDAELRMAQWITSVDLQYAQNLL
jgi:hypothetical protein